MMRLPPAAGPAILVAGCCCPALRLVGPSLLLSSRRPRARFATGTRHRNDARRSPPRPQEEGPPGVLRRQSPRVKCWAGKKRNAID